MTFLRPLTLWLLLAALAAAGEAKISEEFWIEAPFARVTSWVDSHAREIREACNVQLLEQHGDVLVLQRKNNRGNWVWKQRESCTKTPGRWSYVSALVECVEGGMHTLDGVVTIEEVGARTRITATSTARIEDVKERELEYDLKTRARRIRKVIQEAVE